MLIAILKLSPHSIIAGINIRKASRSLSLFSRFRGNIIPIKKSNIIPYLTRLIWSGSCLGDRKHPNIILKKVSGFDIGYLHGIEANPLSVPNKLRRVGIQHKTIIKRLIKKLL